MRVLYDVSHLGQAARVPGGRRGIYRASEAFLLHALADPRLEIQLVAAESRTAQLNLRYFAAATEPALARRILPVGAPGQPLRSTIERAVFTAGVRLRPWFGGHSALWHAAARGPKQLVNRMNRDAHHGGPGTVDVFHSLFAPLPAAGPVPARLRMLTIWDTLPLTMPEHFPDPSARRSVAAALRSLRQPWVHAICTAAAAKTELERRAVLEPERIHVVPLAADEARFHPVRDPERLAAVRRRYGIPLGDYLLTLSAIDPRKNLPHLIRAFRAVQADHAVPAATLVIAGERGLGAGRALSEARLATERGRIVFTGRVADADLAALYSGARAFVFPSLGEGFGLPPLEAMQCGAAVVCSNAPALPEVTGDAALSFPPRDPAALAAALRAVLLDDALVQRLRERGLRRAVQFSWRRTVDETIAVYEDALASLAAAPAATTPGR
ncbi:MAG TPA: glycosyltransferase family 1 protein [Dehalococcoidia bacterium]|nr:glycosyltransferase family 1 protein [Dehalococcoidia bacterium]